MTLLHEISRDTRRAMTLYRYNLRLSQEMFTIISCFEVVLRNRIDMEMVSQYILNQYARMMKPFNQTVLPIVKELRMFQKLSMHPLSHAHLHGVPNLYGERIEYDYCAD